MTDEQALARYVRTGDPAAFSVLVSRYERLVHWVCARRLANAEDRLDAAQETFLRLSQQAGQIEVDVAGWLHRVAMHVCVDRIRADGSRQRRENVVAKAAHAVGDEAADARLLRQEALAQLDEAIGLLDAADRVVLVACGLMDTPQRDMAERLGVSEATVSRRLQKAKERLRAALAERGVVLSLAALSVLLIELQAEAAAVVPGDGWQALAGRPLVAGGTPSSFGLGAAGRQGGMLGRAGLLQLAAVSALAVVGVGMGEAMQSHAGGRDSGGALAVQPVAVADGALRLPDDAEETWVRAKLPIEMEGYWLLAVDGDLPLRLVVDVRLGTMRLESLRGGGRVFWDVESNGKGALRAVVTGSDLQVESVGQTHVLGLDLIDGDRLEWSFVVADREEGWGHATGEVEWVRYELDRLGPAFPLIQKDASGPMKPLTHQQTVFQLLREGSVADLAGVNERVPDYWEVRGVLPEETFRVGYSLSMETQSVLPSLDAWMHRALATELGWWVREERLLKEVWVLQPKAAEGVLLKEVDPFTPREGGGFGIQGDQVVHPFMHLEVAIDAMGSAFGGRVVADWDLYVNEKEEEGASLVSVRGPMRSYAYAEPWPLLPEKKRMERFLEKSGLELVRDRRLVWVKVLEPIPNGTKLEPLVGNFWPQGPSHETLAQASARVKKASKGFVDPELMKALQGEWKWNVNPNVHKAFVGSLEVHLHGAVDRQRDQRQGWPVGVKQLTGADGELVTPYYSLMQVSQLEQTAEGWRLWLVDPLDGDATGVLVKVDGERLLYARHMDMGPTPPVSFDESDLEVQTYWRQPKPWMRASVRQAWPQVLGECPPPPGPRK